MLTASEDLGKHAAKRRRFALDANEMPLSATTIAAGGFVTSSRIYTPGFYHMMLLIDLITPVSTTVDVRVQPTHHSNVGFTADEFSMSVLTTLAGGNRYSVYWGVSRGVVVGALGTGSSYVFSTTYRFVIRNTGAQPVDEVTLGWLECV